ncbi:MAG: recombinase family protein [Deltaproteobacteria bacterium]|nr:recombinase family protein [Deltaproteobacteria bacterium]
MKAALYIRVSTTQQVDRDSLKTQEERLKQYCKAREFSVHKLYKDEGISAKDKNRPALEALLKDAEDKKFNIVVFTRLDRITRSLQDLLFLVSFFEKHDIKLLSLNENINTEGPMGRFMLNLLGALAQLEREIDSERVSTDMHYRAEKGKWNGGIIPFGYTSREKLIHRLRAKGMSQAKAISKADKETPKDKKLYILEEEAKIIRQMYDAYLKEKSLRKVVNSFNLRGLKTRKGDWTTTTIRRMLTNPFYLGYITYGKRKADISTGKLRHVNKEKWKIVKGEHKAIVSEKKFREVQELLTQKTSKPTKSDKTYLLSGILKCWLCGGKMYGYTHTKTYANGTTKEYLYYRCSTTSRKGTSACKGQTIDGETLEKIVTSAILTLSENKQFLTEKAKLINELKKAVKPNTKDKQQAKKQLEKREKELSERRETLLDKLERKIIDDETFTPRFKQINEQLEKIRNEKIKTETLKKESENKILALEASFKELENLAKTWPALTEEARKSRLSVIIKEVLAKKVRSKLKMDMEIYVDSPEEFAKCAEGMSVRVLY